MNLTQHIPDNNSWIADYADKIGWPALIDYYERVYQLLDAMQPGQEFNIAQNVTLANQDLFIKCTVAAMSEIAGLSQGLKSLYLENKSTVILRR